MKFCQDHWDRLRAAIEERGMADLISKDGATVAKRMGDELARAADRPDAEGALTIANFDPLMAAHWAIVNNSMETIKRAGGNPLYLMFGDEDTPEDPVELPGGEGRTWPRCPLCYLNIAHELTCKDERCTLDTERGYDWMIERAADDSAQKWQELKDAA